MPYCDDKRAIFLHVPKTAGTFVKDLFRIRRFDDPGPDVRPSPQHLTCEQLRQRIGDKKYDHYYKFTFIRNPWARILSSYYWRTTLPRKREAPPFIEFIELVARTVPERNYYALEFGEHFIPQTEYSRDVDEVFRFEEIEVGIHALAERFKVKVGRLAAREPKPSDRYWKFYDERSRRLLGETYAEEIEQFGFTFGGHGL